MINANDKKNDEDEYGMEVAQTNDDEMKNINSGKPKFIWVSLVLQNEQSFHRQIAVQFYATTNNKVV